MIFNLKLFMTGLTSPPHDENRLSHPRKAGFHIGCFHGKRNPYQRELSRGGRIRLSFLFSVIFLISACTVRHAPVTGKVPALNAIETYNPDRIKIDPLDPLLRFLKEKKDKKVLVDPQNDAFFVDVNVKKYFTGLIFDAGCNNILTPTQAAMLQGFLAESHRQSTQASQRNILKFCAEKGYDYLLRYAIPPGQGMTVSILKIVKAPPRKITGEVVKNLRLGVLAFGEKTPWANNIIKSRSMITKKISDLIDGPLEEFKTNFDKFCDVSGYMHLHTDMDPKQFEHRFKSFLHESGCGDIPVVKNWELPRERTRNDFTNMILSRPTTYGLEFNVSKEKLTGSSDGRAYCMYYLDVKVYDSVNPHTDLSFLNAFMAVDYVEETRKAEKKI